MNVREKAHSYKYGFPDGKSNMTTDEKMKIVEFLKKTKPIGGMDRGLEKPTNCIYINDDMQVTWLTSCFEGFLANTQTIDPEFLNYVEDQIMAEENHG